VYTYNIIGMLTSNQAIRDNPFIHNTCMILVNNNPINRRDIIRSYFFCWISVIICINTKITYINAGEHNKFNNINTI